MKRIKYIGVTISDNDFINTLDFFLLAFCHYGRDVRELEKPREVLRLDILQLWKETWYSCYLLGQAELGTVKRSGSQDTTPVPKLDIFFDEEIWTFYEKRNFDVNGEFVFINVNSDGYNGLHHYIIDKHLFYAEK